MSDLRHDSLKLPAELFVKFFDLLRVISWGLVLCAELGLQNALEKVHPGGDALGHPKEVRGHNKLHGD